MASTGAPAIKLVLKAQPEDFIVEEIARLPLKKSGKFAVFLLKKSGWNTVGLLLELGQRLQRPAGDFSYGGRKDRHGLTSQYITIKGRRPDAIEGPGYALTFCGFLDRPMGPDLIEANRFAITVRRLTPAAAQAAASRVPPLETAGYANYFDDQRFGSYDERQGFFAEKLLKGHYNGALKIFLTSPSTTDAKEEKERKRYLFAHWGDWRLCAAAARSSYEREAFSRLTAQPGDFLLLLRRIPRERMLIYISAYQAFIWNEVLRRIVRSAERGTRTAYPGRAGDYIFSSDPAVSLAELAIPLPGARADASIPDEAVQGIYAAVMEENGLRRALFNRLGVRSVFFKATLRPAAVKPRGIAFRIGDDELSPRRKKLELFFSLPAGSFGTMCVKRLFSEAYEG